MVALGVLYLALIVISPQLRRSMQHRTSKNPSLVWEIKKNVKVQVSYTAHLLIIYAFSAWNRVVLRVVYLIQARLCSWVTS